MTIAWIATRDLQWVKGVFIALIDTGGTYWGDGPPTAANVAREMQRELSRLWCDANQLSFTDALGKLMSAVEGDLAFFDDSDSPAVGRALQVVGLRFSGGKIGFEVNGSDDDYRYREVSFDPSDVTSRWPAPARELSGDPGAPSKSAELYLGEFARRVSSGEVEFVLRAEANALSHWLETNFPSKPKPTITTIENRIRAGYRAWKISRSTK